VFDQSALAKFFVMTLRTTLLLVAWSLSVPSAYAQELEDFSDSALTGEQWQQRVLDARRRSEEFVANARTHAADTRLSDREDAEAADQRIMNDPSLQRGDIIATSKGLLVFVGRNNDQRQPGDFVPVPNTPHPP
jgi:hypothetical protein